MAPLSAVTVTVIVLDPTVRFSSAVLGVLVSPSFVMATVALALVFLAVSVTASIRLATAVV